MSRAITKRQKEILEFIENQIRESGYPPSIREICDNFSFKSTNAVVDHLDALVRKGYLSRESSKSRAIMVLKPVLPVPASREGIPVMGTIAAGQPIFASEFQLDTLPIDPSMVGSGTHFGLKVRGNSMIEAGIMPGDIVIIRQQPVADNDQIAAVMVGEDEATLKRYFRVGSKIKLEPANPHIPTIWVNETECKVLGIVVGLWRNYRDQVQGIY